MNGPDPEIIYADIYHHPHHQSSVHPHMSLYDRAAQFAPFAALSGYDDMVEEEARYTETEAVPTESTVELLNRKLLRIAEQIRAGEHPLVSVTYFEPDAKKEGGAYRTVREQIKAVDPAAGQLILMRTEGRAGMHAVIDLNRISEIQ